MAGTPPKSSGSSISTYRSTASSATTTRDGLWSAPNATSSPAARLPMTRFWRAMPTAPAAAARPAAPTTVPKMRPLMLNGWSFRSPRCRRRLVDLGVDVPADQPAADAGHDLVADRVDGVRPVLGRGLAEVTGPEEDDLGPGRRQLAVQVDDELVHAHAAADRSLGVADPDVGGVAGGPRHALAVAGRHDADGGVLGRRARCARRRRPHRPGRPCSSPAGPARSSRAGGRGAG